MFHVFSKFSENMIMNITFHQSERRLKGERARHGDTDWTPTYRLTLPPFKSQIMTPVVVDSGDRIKTKTCQRSQRVSDAAVQSALNINFLQTSSKTLYPRSASEIGRNSNVQSRLALLPDWWDIAAGLADVMKRWVLQHQTKKLAPEKIAAGRM